MLYVVCLDYSDVILNDVFVELVRMVGKYVLIEEGVWEFVKVFVVLGVDFWEFMELVKLVKVDFEVYFIKDVVDKLYEVYEIEIWNGKYVG